jgi:hypothetical protein
MQTQTGSTRYNSTLSLSFTLHGGGWSTPRPGRFTPGAHCRGGWVGPRAGLAGCGKSPPPSGIRYPDRPARSESVYRQSYPELPTENYGLIKRILRSQSGDTCLTYKFIDLQQNVNYSEVYFRKFTYNSRNRQYNSHFTFFLHFVLQCVI